MAKKSSKKNANSKKKTKQKVNSSKSSKKNNSKSKKTKKQQSPKKVANNFSKSSTTFTKDLQNVIDSIDQSTSKKKSKKQAKENQQASKSSVDSKIKSVKIKLIEFKDKASNKSKSFLKEAKEVGIKLGVIFLILTLFSSAVVVLELISSDRVLPKVAIANVEIGYLKAQEAESMIKDSIEDFYQQPITFVLDEKRIEVTLPELGIDMNIDDTINSIPKYYFLEDSILSLITANLNSHEIKPYYDYDLNNIEKILENKFSLQNLRAESAKFYLDEEDIIQIQAEKQGKKIDINSLNTQLQNKLNGLDESEIIINIRDEKPAVVAEDLEKNSDDLLLKLENEIKLVHQQDEWLFKAKDHLDKFEYLKNNEQIIIKLSDRLLTEFLQPEIIDDIAIQTSDIKIYHDQDDQIIFEGKAKDGVEVNQEKLADDLESAINTYEGEVEVESKVMAAKVNTDQKLQNLGIQELIGTGHTAFAGSSPNRIHNINVAMDRFNGVLIAPGETFSFNDQLGPVDGSTGYKMELVIKSTGTIPEYGGGVCQVSSTAFKAALFSGLEIAERYPHSYAVSYYAQIDGYGLDATIYPGVKDLKFVNDTPAHILIQAYTEGTEAFFKFYGTNDGREAFIKNYNKFNHRSSGGTQLIPTNTLAPGQRKQVETASPGFDTTWDWIVKMPDGTEKKEEIVSRYRATANKILVGEE
ncbi:hypothetical protein GF376_02360 [Candidatus Peregrinibacteria bacterium]|nr:hypothetical protein [Candidatus Peregrinibacteria bacterium]